MAAKIYTKTGDHGKTDAGNGARVDKDDLAIEVLGTLDELNSSIGLIITVAKLPDNILTMLLALQKDIINLTAEITQTSTKISVVHIQKLEQAIDQLNQNLPPLKTFILPNENHAAACCHQARTICRRAERRLVSLAKQQKINPQTLAYINRLSDLLFVIARTITNYNN